MEEVHHEYYDEIGLMTEDDMAFVHSVIGKDILSVDELNKALNDPKLRRQLLDSPRIYEEMMRDTKALDVSEYFYYCTAVRQLMLACGLMEQDYTDNVAASLVRMAHMQRKSFNRGEYHNRYLPLNLHVVKERGEYGCHIRIYSRMDPYEMLLEGFQVDVDAYKKEATAAGSSELEIA